MASPDEVNASVLWKYKNFPTKIKLYEVADGTHPRLWETRSVKNINSIPIGNEITDTELRIRKGERKRFVLVAKNMKSRPIYFFAAPHVVEPVEHSLGFKFKCLCINHAFSIGPKETWYRVVELRISSGLIGKDIKITHSIIGINKKRMEQFSLKKRRLPEF